MLTRVRRIRGQVEAIERTLNVESEGETILQLVAACRGALNGLMVELIEGHLRSHVLGKGHVTLASQRQAADELVAVVKRYFNYRNRLSLTEGDSARPVLNPAYHAASINPGVPAVCSIRRKSPASLP